MNIQSSFLEDCVINPSQQLDLYSFLFWTCGHLIGKLSYSKIRSPVAKNMARVTKVMQQRQLKSILHAYDKKNTYTVHIYSSYLLKPLPLTFTITHPTTNPIIHFNWRSPSQSFCWTSHSLYWIGCWMKWSHRQHQLLQPYKVLRNLQVTFSPVEGPGFLEKNALVYSNVFLIEKDNWI